MARKAVNSCDRFCLAKDYTRVDGRTSWGVFDTISRKFVEGGFFSKARAIACMDQHNRADPFGGNAANRPQGDR